MPLDIATLQTREFHRILLVKLSAVGDVVHTIPVLNKLRRRYPSARIDWLITPAIGELIRHHPAVDRIVQFARHEWSEPWRWPPLRTSVRLAAQLRAARYDLVVDIHGQFRTALLTLATGAPVRIGFDRPRPHVWEASGRTLPPEARKHAWKGAREGSWLAYTHRIAVPTLDVHAVDRYLSIGPMLGLDTDPPDFSFPIPAAAVAGVDVLLARHGIGGTGAKLLTIAPGTIWETKHWRGEGFAEVARAFRHKGFEVVLIGSARERAACDEVASLAPGAVNLAGETGLSELAALIRRSTACLTNDSGPMHLAVALGRPVVSVFGPTDPVWIGPYRRPDAVVAAGLSCAPCYLRRLSRCPHDHACMREVSAETVIARIETVLAAPADGARSEAPAPRPVALGG